MSDYWIVESPKATDRLAEADRILAREYLRECEFTAEYVNTSRMLKHVFWVVVWAVAAYVSAYAVMGGFR